MPKIPLTIKVDYLPTWGAWEGIRELIQNGRDAEVELSAPLTVDWQKGKLRIENEGCTLPHEALLLGHTSKYGRQELIGKFGEGLKLGILALVRAGHKVKIRSGEEVWDPKIERSETFKADVLVFNITRGRTERDRVRVEIDGVSREDWDSMKDRFLFLDRQVATDEIVATDHGELLLSEGKRGRVFVKGIFVSYDEKLNYGYNLADADLDRDRRIIHSYDLQSRTRRIWAEAASKRPDLLGALWSLLDKDAPDIQALQWSADMITDTTREGLVEKFVERYGAGAVPVENLEQSKDVEHLGKVGIVTPASLRAVLSQQLGTVATVLESLRSEVVKTYGWHELDVFERAAMDNAIKLANHGALVDLSIVDVVDFRSETLMGQFKDGRVAIAKKWLAKPSETLATLVHELAHRDGGDGDKGHVAAIERIWSAIVEALLVKLRGEP